MKLFSHAADTNTSLNASPIYTITFLLGYYILQKPCVYCSILLFVLVFSILDFGADWFEPRWTGWAGDASAATETAAAYLRGNATLAEVVLETASLAISVVNGTGGSIASAAMGDVKRRMTADSGSTVATIVPNGLSAFEWLRNILDKRALRIPCLGVVVRL